MNSRPDPQAALIQEGHARIDAVLRSATVPAFQKADAELDAWSILHLEVLLNELLVRGVKIAVLEVENDRLKAAVEDQEKREPEVSAYLRTPCRTLEQARAETLNASAHLTGEAEASNV